MHARNIGNEALSIKDIDIIVKKCVWRDSYGCAQCSVQIKGFVLCIFM